MNEPTRLGRLPWPLVNNLSRLPGMDELPWRWAEAQDPRRLCKHLELVGWELWDEAKSPDGGLPLAVHKTGPWPLALWATAYYRGPATVIEDGAEKTRRLELGKRSAPLHRIYLSEQRTEPAGGGRPLLRVTAETAGPGYRLTVERI